MKFQRSIPIVDHFATLFHKNDLTKGYTHSILNGEGYSIKHQASRSGFTLMELLIVVTLLGVIAVGLLVALNPQAQINKAKDAKRKSDLAVLKKTFEDFYNDNNRYPQPAEVCTTNSNNTPCTICGLIPGSPANFNPYLSHLPCDPDNPNRRYLYSVPSGSGQEASPFSYRLYVQLGNLSDNAIIEAGCQGNICGPSGPGQDSYNYGVSSPNVDLERHAAPTPTPLPIVATPTPPVTCTGRKYKLNISYQCNEFFGLYSDCTSNDPCYSDPGRPGPPQYRGCFIQCAP